MTSVLRAVRGRARGDDGASLVLVMAFVVCVGLVLTALLSYSQSAITSAAATQSRQQLAGDASGALDVAINSLRHTDYANSAAPCPVDGLSVPGAQGELRVRCEPDMGTGVSAGVVPINKLNRPGSAVLTLENPAQPVGAGNGELVKESNGILRIKGKVYVNGKIDTSSGTVCTPTSTNCSLIEVDEAPVTAKRGCDPAFVRSTVSVTCPSASASVEGLDPAAYDNITMPPNATTGHPGGNAIAAAYQQPLSGPAQMVHRVVPPLTDCPSSGNVTFEPGYYDDAVALSTFTNGCSRPLHFKPGPYYFDFRNKEADAVAAGVTAGDNVWTIDNSAARIVGGTLTVTGPSTIPGSCVSPLTTTVVDKGVQFVFGGTSRIDIKAGKVELCGQYHPDKPSLVLYGAKSGTTVDSGPIRGSMPTAVAPTTSVPAWTAPEAARVADGALASTTITRVSGSDVTTTLELTGMDAATQIPAGSVLVAAELRVTHKESAKRAGDDIRIDFTPNPGRSGPVPPATISDSATPINDATPSTLTTHTIPLTAALAPEVRTYGLSNVRLQYTVIADKLQASNPTFKADLDAVQLWLRWKPPSLRGQGTAVGGSACVSTGTACPLVRTDGAQTSLYLQGSTYAPLAHFKINLTSVSGQVFKSGIVARSLTIAVTPSAGFVGPVIEIPEETGSGVSLDVNLTAYSCRVASCAASPPPGPDWRRVGRSTVTLDSAFPVPTNGSRAVTVRNWNLLS